jgi:mannitol/fructose-specific phosphotransferase system IIA component (Ntr-type)
MNNLLTNAEAPGTSDDIANRLANASSEEEILTILSGQ